VTNAGQVSDIESDIIEHYAASGLLARLEAALRADGADPAHPLLKPAGGRLVPKST
jgi:hypothetical protein